MGAADFWVRASGKTAREAFSKAVDDAQYEHGHGGYTGTIAEKYAFKIIDVPTGADPVAFSRALLYEVVERWVPGDKDDWLKGAATRMRRENGADVYEKRVTEPLPPEWARIRQRYESLLDDKYGPALCVVEGKLSDDTPKFIFFGMAPE